MIASSISYDLVMNAKKKTELRICPIPAIKNLPLLELEIKKIFL